MLIVSQQFFLLMLLNIDICNCYTQVKLGSQYYFYMETQTALAVPDEDNCMIVYTSNQSPDIAQQIIANFLGVPHHNVRAITRRVGGGFGGKATRAMSVSININLSCITSNTGFRI